MKIILVIFYFEEPDGSQKTNVFAPVMPAFSIFEDENEKENRG